MTQTMTPNMTPTSESSSVEVDELSLSLVIPMYNEEDNVRPMTTAIHEALAEYEHPWELIYVNDGSSDNTLKTLHEVAEEHGNHVRVVELQRNFGQTAAMQAGIDYARGEILVTMDGDLQNDPRDIPRMVDRLHKEDLDLLAGWRKDRKDNLWMRKVPSRIANIIIGKLSGIQLNDYGCSLKVYRMDVIKSVRFYGEMHRFIPAWMATHTSPSRIKEEVVNHHARQFGESKYGLSRVYRVILDLLSVYFFMGYRAKPAHFFGRIGLTFGAVGSLILSYLLVIKFGFGEDIGNRPLLITGVLFVVVSIQFFTTGIVSEMITRTYYESSGAKPYIVRERSCKNTGQDCEWKKQ